MMMPGPSVLLRCGMSTTRTVVGGVSRATMSSGGGTARSLPSNGHNFYCLSALTMQQASRTRTCMKYEEANIRIYSSLANCTQMFPKKHVKHEQYAQHAQQHPLCLSPLISSGRIPFNKSCAFLLQHQLGTVSHFSSQIPPPRRGGSRLAQGAGLLGAASLLFGKTKYVLAALKLTKLASLGSMVVSIGAYSMFFGLPYACGMVGLITVHEAGHAYVMHQRGIPFTPMVFLPFMGAVIATKDMPRDAWEDALIAAGGPVVGSIGAGAVALAAHMTESQLLYALADFGFMINLFNLLPIGSMDGGRWAGALSKYVGVAGVGFGGLIAYQGLVANPLFYIILLAGAYETFQKFYSPHFLPPNYYAITNAQRMTLTVSYFGLVVALLAAMEANQRNRKSPEQLIRERQLHEPMWDDSASHF